jgi:hypothetical protein
MAGFMVHNPPSGLTIEDNLYDATGMSVGVEQRSGMYTKVSLSSLTVRNNAWVLPSANYSGNYQYNNWSWKTPSQWSALVPGDTFYDSYTAAVAGGAGAPAKPTIGGAASIDEGLYYTLSLNPGGWDSSRLHWRVNWGDGMIQQITGPAASATHAYGDGPGNYNISVTANDGIGNYTPASQAVTVENADPVVLVSDNEAFVQGQAGSIAVAFTDPGWLDTHTALIDWGDGTTTTPTFVEADGAGDFIASHAYVLAGTYNASVTITDDDGGAASGLLAISVSETTPTAPAAPTGLAASGTQWSDHVEFSWQDNADDEEYYLIEWSEDGQAWYTIDELPADSTSYVDEYPMLGGQYYRVAVGRGTETPVVSQSDSIAIEPVAPPVAWYDDNGGANDRGTLSPFHTVHDHSLIVNVIPNDVDYDSSSIFIPPGGYTQPSNGSITFDQQTGLFTYTPDAEYVGTDTFTYWVNDGHADSAPATVAIDVTNALPELGNILLKMEAPYYSPFNSVQWNGQSYEGAAIGLATASDADGDPVTFRVVDQPSQGIVEMNPHTGQFLYVMGSGFNGADSFTYTAGDGLEESTPRRIPVFGEFQVSGESLDVEYGPPPSVGNRWIFPAGGLPEHGTMMILNTITGTYGPAQAETEYHAPDEMIYQYTAGYEGLDRACDSLCGQFAGR